MGRASYIRKRLILSVFVLFGVTVLIFGMAHFLPGDPAMILLGERATTQNIALLREQLGGTYSPGVGGGCNRTPRQEYAIQVQFGSAPENVEKLSKSVFALIDTLKKEQNVTPQKMATPAKKKP